MRNLNIERGKLSVYLKVIYKSRLDLISDSEFGSMNNLISEVRLYTLTMPSAVLNRDEFFSYILQSYYVDEASIADPSIEMGESIQREFKSKRFKNLVQKFYQAMKAGIRRAKLSC